MSLTKHLVNDPSAIVVQSLQGLAAANPQLALDEANKVLFIAPAYRGDAKVALISGGGSGHEPAHVGFVGKGMLDAAVCGNVFASPSTTQVLRGIDLVDNKKGIVIFVKNYTGDVLNFGLAKEQYAALHPDKADSVRFVNVGDDVAVGRTQGALVGRRGLAGTVLVYKIAGALAAEGAEVDDVDKIAQWFASRMGTIGVGLEHCHVPGTAVSKESHLKADEIEIGMGIHNEPGHQRCSPVPPLNELVAKLLDLITSTTDPERSFVPFRGDGTDQVVVMVNNLGGVSELELGGITTEVVKQVEKRGLTIARVLSGTFMTSLNMPGFSITLALLPFENEADSPVDTSTLLSLLDAPTETPGWKWSGCTAYSTFSGIPATTEATITSDLSGHLKLRVLDAEVFKKAVMTACEDLIAEEPEITRMDSIAGDGDCGLTLKAGATAVLTGFQDGTVSGQDAVGATRFISDVAMKHMGGTSGALYSIFFSALAQALQISPPPNGTVTAATWAGAIESALTKLYTYTRARPPSRTLVDPLSVFVSRLCRAFGPDAAAAFGPAVRDAAESALATRDVEAKAGRSAYTESEKLMGERVPDPGAWGVKVILEGLMEGSGSA